MGYFSSHTDIYDLSMFRDAIEPMQDNDFIRNLIYREAREYPHKCVRLEPGSRKRNGAASGDETVTQEFIYADLAHEVE